MTYMAVTITVQYKKRLFDCSITKNAEANTAINSTTCINT